MLSLAQAQGQRPRMKSKRSAINKPILKPQYPIIFVSGTSTIEINKELIAPNIVGEKAYGLSCLPRCWTLPFIVVSADLIQKINNCNESNCEDLVKDWANKIISAAMMAGIGINDTIIVRSSGLSEGLDERGKFCSTDGILNMVYQPLVECIKKLTSDNELKNQHIALIIQKYAIPISAKGHLSNERRFYKESRDWIGDYEEIKTSTGKPFQINLRNWRKRINVNNQVDKSLDCNLTAHISQILHIPAAWAYEQGLRLHFEWVWDGKSIYLVQADQEYEINGVDPLNSLNLERNPLISFEPKCLKQITEDHAKRFNKVRNVFVYFKLGLPTTRLFVLDEQSVINELAKGIVLSDLEEDLSVLVKGSLVIRTDIATSNKDIAQLLPRTDGIRELDNAISWLIEKSSELKKEVKEDVIFIFHNFVPAEASAFAYAEPGKRKVQIEALWGLPEGLYYNSHDKFVVDTLKPNISEINRDVISQFDIQHKYNYKKYFVSPDESGQWKTQILTPPYDWRSSIRKEDWIKGIALESRRIANEESNPLSIMWFIGVPKEVCPSPIFPWYHELYDPRLTIRTPTHRTKTPFDKSITIKNSEDIEVLKQESLKERSSVRRVRIQPQEEKLLRDKNTLKIIGAITKKIGAIILLEGGVLSHAYYQLMQTNAVVEVLNPFDDYEDKRDFYKLVRDKVPSNIERGGELVKITRLRGESFLRALREKLVEESFEVLDATDQDSIIGELADLSEVIDGILHKLGVRKDELRQRQDRKREKAGGFNDGIVLLKTSNPLPTKLGLDNNGKLFDDEIDFLLHDEVFIDEHDLIEFSHAMDKWSDRREHQAASEVLLHITVPIIRDKWGASTPEVNIDLETGTVVMAKVIGKRLGSKIQIELSIFTQHKQLKLF